MKPRKYKLRLYVSGATPRSKQAIKNITAIGKNYLHGDYELEIIDAYQQQDLLREQQIIALPTLIKSLPEPLRRLVGDLSDEDKVIIGLGIAEDKPHD